MGKWRTFQVVVHELDPAHLVDGGELRALQVRLGVAPQHPYVMKEGQQDAEQRVLRVNHFGRIGGGRCRLAVEQARHCQPAVERMAQIVVMGVATQQTRILAGKGSRQIHGRLFQQRSAVATAEAALEQSVQSIEHGAGVRQVDSARRIELHRL